MDVDEIANKLPCDSILDPNPVAALVTLELIPVPTVITSACTFPSNGLPTYTYIASLLTFIDFPTAALANFVYVKSDVSLIHGELNVNTPQPLALALSTHTRSFFVHPLSGGVALLRSVTVLSLAGFNAYVVPAPVIVLDLIKDCSWLGDPVDVGMSLRVNIIDKGVGARTTV